MKPIRDHALDWIRYYPLSYDSRVVVGRCQCGEESPVGLTVADRRQWHRDHKASIEPNQ